MGFLNLELYSQSERKIVTNSARKRKRSRKESTFNKRRRKLHRITGSGEKVEIPKGHPIELCVPQKCQNWCVL